MPEKIRTKSCGCLDFSAIRILRLLAVMLLAACLSSRAQAASLLNSISLYTPATATSRAVPIAYSLPGYCGQTDFNNSVTDQYGNVLATLNLAVDYAVFAPGQFSNSAFNQAGIIEPNGSFSVGNFTATASDYVYAYQIFNTGNPKSSLSTSLLALSIGFNPALSKMGTVIDSDGESNATLPANSTVVKYTSAVVDSTNADATVFGYYSTQIGPGQESYFLLTSSPYSPNYSGTLTYGSYTYNAGGSTEYLSSPNSTIPVAGAQAIVPVPLPQAWKQVLFMGAVALVLARFRTTSKSDRKWLARLQ